MPPSPAEPPPSPDADFRAGGAEGLVRAGDETAAIPLQFFDNLRIGLLKSLNVGNPQAGTTAIFIFADRPREVASKIGTSTRVFDLDMRPPSVWQSQIVVASREGTTGWAMPFINGTDTDSISAVIAAGYGDRPTAIVYPDQAIMSCMIDGPANTDSPIRMNLPVQSRTVTAENIAEVLEIIRAEGLSTPAVCPPDLWVDGAQYIPGRETERLLQWCVASEMRAFFRPIVAEREQIIRIGRIDICLTDPKGTINDGNLHPAVIELKALRSRTHNNTAVTDRSNVFGIIKGMRQTKAYKLTKNAQLGVLACFDLRKAKTELFSEPAIVEARNRYGYGPSLFMEMLKLYGDPDHAQEAVAAATP